MVSALEANGVPRPASADRPPVALLSLKEGRAMAVITDKIERQVVLLDENKTGGRPCLSDS